MWLSFCFFHVPHIIYLCKREMTQMDDKKAPSESVEIPKGSQEEEEEEVRDRVKNIGEERRGERGVVWLLSWWAHSSQADRDISMELPARELFSGISLDLPLWFNMHVHITLQNAHQPTDCTVYVRHAGRHLLARVCLHEENENCRQILQELPQL